MSLQWPPRSEAKKASRVGRNQYKCAICLKLFKDKETQMDHVESVVDIKGYKDIETYVRRMLPKKEGFRTLCISCHSDVTEEQKVLRILRKKVKK